MSVGHMTALGDLLEAYWSVLERIEDDLELLLESEAIMIARITYFDDFSGAWESDGDIRSSNVANSSPKLDQKHLENELRRH
jgi:hypothetical protein